MNSEAPSDDLPGRRRHSSDHAGSEQYVYERPADWTPSARRRRYAEPDEDTPVDWWGESPRRSEPSAWDADALRAAAGVPYRQQPPVPPVPPAYEIPEQRRPAEPNPEFDAEVPDLPPVAAKAKQPRKNLILRMAAVMVLVVSGAVGVAVTVLNDADPDTVQVKDEIQADAPLDTSSPAATAGQQSSPPAEDTDLLAQQKQDAAVSAAKSRAADKAAAAQKTAAQQAERAEDQRASRSAARTAAAEKEETTSTSSSSSSSSGSSGDPVPAGPADCSSYSGNKKTGCSLLSEFGFATSQMSCLEKLWTKESGWRESAQNPSSGAYGIPQALPGSKMATVAGDWKTNPATQIRWGLGYIKGRYGTPCGAWSHSQSTGWY